MYQEENIAVINDAKVGEALEELIRIAAEEIIVKGLNKQNDNDYMKSFLPIGMTIILQDIESVCSL